MSRTRAPERAPDISLESLEPALRQFALPQENGAGELPEAVARAYAWGIAQLFLEAHADEIGSRSNGLMPPLEEWAGEEPDFEVA